MNQRHDLDPVGSDIPVSIATTTARNLGPALLVVSTVSANSSGLAELYLQCRPALGALDDRVDLEAGAVAVVLYLAADRLRVDP